jgi:hypothetical protein
VHDVHDSVHGSGIHHIDLLQVDAEGYDAEILRLFDVPHENRLSSVLNTNDSTSLTTNDLSVLLWTSGTHSRFVLRILLRTFNLTKT